MAPSKKPGSISSKRISAPSKQVSDPDIDLFDEDLEALSPEQILARLKNIFTDEGLEGKTNEELKDMLQRHYLLMQDAIYENNMRNLSKREKPKLRQRHNQVNFDEQVDVAEFDDETSQSSKQAINESSQRAQSRINKFLHDVKTHIDQHPQEVDTPEKMNEFIERALIRSKSYGIECEDERDLHNLTKKLKKAATLQIEEAPASPSETDFFDSIARTDSFTHGVASAAQRGELDNLEDIEKAASDSGSDSDAEDENDRSSLLQRSSSFARIRGLPPQSNPANSSAPNRSDHQHGNEPISPKARRSPLAEGEPAEAAGDDDEEIAPRPSTRNAFGRLHIGKRLPKNEADEFDEPLPTSRGRMSSFRAHEPPKKADEAQSEEPKHKK
jgi:hypothetical protein